MVYTKYLLTVCDYKSALELSDFYRHQMILNLDDGLIHELTFLTALGYYYMGQQDRFLTLFKLPFSLPIPLTAVMPPSVEIMFPTTFLQLWLKT